MTSAVSCEAKMAFKDEDQVAATSLHSMQNCLLAAEKEQVVDKVENYVTIVTDQGGNSFAQPTKNFSCNTVV